ncbi:bifunctional transcriptional activator/DNA repair enzyme AdaA (plasmid) [Streptomyces sp. BI20]|uniref:bifunctional transcriptional activator/DNA repair enzyme AdaA n=1 Tax=Streptomyces sp. BI20 TaxID=3403460 RepID=UPI003C729CF0
MTGGYGTDEERWRAVVARDGAADGAFYYAVTTTGIYSRPSCAARLARRENVEFHTSVGELRARGYRPCRRCRPGESDPRRAYADTVARACRLMDAAVAPPNLDELAQEAGYSRFHFHRLFRSLTGVTPYAYWTAVRAARVRAELRGARTVSDAIYRAGFNTNGQFYAVSPGILGMTPQAFRAGGAGVEVRSAVAVTSLGRILVATADKGVCAVLSEGPGVGAARQRLAALFPRAVHRPAGPRLADLVEGVVAGAEASGAAPAALPAEVLRVCLHERVRQGVQERLVRSAGAVPGVLAGVPDLRAG